MEDSHIGLGFLDTTEIKFLAKLDYVVLEIYYLILCVSNQFEPEKVCVTVLVFTNILIHKAQFLMILVFEARGTCSYLGDFLLFGQQIQKNE